ncbi:hypothetical protein BH09MYX1_BH09MYX1_04770 [soil metagenome]
MRCLAFLAAVPLVACLATPTGPAALQQTSQEFNLHTRFGRMEVAMSDVSDDYREEFTRRHSMWNGMLHVTDAEVAGMKFVDDDNADVVVRVGWYRSDVGDLCVTSVKQKWHRYKIAWRLDGEERLDGAIGILGEKVEIVRPEGPAAQAQFPTVHLKE